jgi:hypothetical protein
MVNPANAITTSNPALLKIWSILEREKVIVIYEVNKSP